MKANMDEESGWPCVFDDDDNHNSDQQDPYHGDSAEEQDEGLTAHEDYHTRSCNHSEHSASDPQFMSWPQSYK